MSDKRRVKNNHNKYGIEVGKTYGNYEVLEQVKVSRKISKGDGTYTECLAVKWKCRYIPDNSEKIVPTAYLAEFKTKEQEDEYMKNLVIENKHQKGYRSYLMRTYVTGAKNRGHEFNLTKEQFEDIITKNCYYCGKEPQPATEEQLRKRGNIKQPTFYYNGIDRLDSSKGYVLDNCVPCCTTCNYMKRTLSVDEFYNQIKSIYEHQNLNENNQKL